MAQERKTLAQVAEVVDRVEYPGKNLRVIPYGDGYAIQIEYWEMDVVSGEDALQRGRKWIVSPFATDSEIVQTCLTACLASAEHQVREHFAYAGPCPACDGVGEYPDSGESIDPAMVACPHCEGTGRGKPRAIFGPHFSSDVLYSICGKRANYDAREDPE